MIIITIITIITTNYFILYIPKKNFQHSLSLWSRIAIILYMMIYICHYHIVSLTTTFNFFFADFFFSEGVKLDEICSHFYFHFFSFFLLNCRRFQDVARKLDRALFPDEPDVPGLTFLTPIEWAPWMETIWYVRFGFFQFFCNFFYGLKNLFNSYVRQ